MIKRTNEITNFQVIKERSNERKEVKLRGKDDERKKKRRRHGKMGTKKIMTEKALKGERKEGRKEGRKNRREEGRKNRREEGRKERRKEGRKEGRKQCIPLNILVSSSILGMTSTYKLPNKEQQT